MVRGRRSLVGWGTLLITLGLAAEAAAQTVDICTEAVKVVNHPAVFISERVRKGLPHCAEPLSQGLPDCWFDRLRQVSPPWSETAKSVECDTHSIEVGFTEFMRRKTDIRLWMPEVKALSNFIELLVGKSLAEGQPLPTFVRDKLGLWLAEHDLHFSQVDINNARFVSHENNPLSPQSYKAFLGPNAQDSIVWGNLVVAGPGLQAAKGCPQLASWAHELVHVRQYRDAGFYNFQVQYLEERKSYKEKSYEVEAYRITDLVTEICEDNLATIDAIYEQVGGRMATVQERDQAFAATQRSWKQSLVRQLGEPRVPVLAGLAKAALGNATSFAQQLARLFIEPPDEGCLNALRLTPDGRADSESVLSVVDASTGKCFRGPPRAPVSEERIPDAEKLYSAFSSAVVTLQQTVEVERKLSSDMLLYGVMNADLATQLTQHQASVEDVRSIVKRWTEYEIAKRRWDNALMDEVRRLQVGERPRIVGLTKDGGTGSTAVSLSGLAIIRK